MSWEYDNWHKLLLEKLFWKKFHNFIAEEAKAFMPYFEVLKDGFVKRPCDADPENIYTVDKQTITKWNKVRKLNYI